MSKQQQRHLQSLQHFLPTPSAKASSRPKPRSNRRVFFVPYQDPRQIPTEKGGLNGHEMVGCSRECISERDAPSGCEGSLEVAAEVEVGGTEEVGETAEGMGTASGDPEQPRPHELASLPRLPISMDRLRPFPRSRRSLRPNSANSIQQLLRFDPNQCFDIEEFRVRMAAAQQKIKDFGSLNLNNVKLKQENGQLREKLDKCERRISLLESSVLERNERLRELLRENVFMRAQFKKVQNEFGVQAVNEVFNGRRGRANGEGHTN